MLTEVGGSGTTWRGCLRSTHKLRFNSISAYSVYLTLCSGGISNLSGNLFYAVTLPSSGRFWSLLTLLATGFWPFSQLNRRVPAAQLRKRMCKLAVMQIQAH